MPGLAVLLAGAALAVAVPGSAPGDAPPSTASFTAEDFSWHVTGDATSSSVTIAAGGTVTFGYPSGRTMHNADFAGGPAPSSCTQTAGTPGGTPPPLPTSPTAPGWSGTCRFDAPGTYAFHCDLHPSLMRGTIVVVAPGPPPTTTTTAGSPPPPTSTGPGTPKSAPTPPHRARLRMNVSRVQLGSVLRGVVIGAPAGARIDVTALGWKRALGRRDPGRPHRVPVGSVDVRAAGSGPAPFAVTLDPLARRALRRRHHLGVKLRIVVASPGGTAVVELVRVVVRDRRPARARQMSG